DSVVKERFDQAFRLNQGRAFYSSLSICQAVFRRIFSFYSTTCRNLSFISSASVRRSFYSGLLLRQVAFEEIFFPSQQLSASSKLVRFSEARILHEPGRL
ncbi:hypothetical protein, partial [Pseudomonas sp. NCCP-436]|uniref:hypothetical protein n=1 Tax=Pseudomonas sp. NCCP-436 TaxID=2842481 RepID=UPI001C815A23